MCAPRMCHTRETPGGRSITRVETGEFFVLKMEIKPGVPGTFPWVIFQRGNPKPIGSMIEKEWAERMANHFNEELAKGKPDKGDQK